jgi:hypothetical protein
MELCDGLGYKKRPELRDSSTSSLNTASFEILLTYRISRAGFVTALSGCLFRHRPFDELFVDNPGAVTRSAGIIELQSCPT